MGKIKNVLIVWFLLFLQFLWASSIHVQKDWNLLSNFDTNQSLECLLEKFDKPVSIWFYDNHKKVWLAKSNSDTVNIAISNHGIASPDTLQAYQSFWLNSPNEKDVTFDCNISEHIDFNKTKILAGGWNLISNIDANQSTLFLLNELNSTGVIFAYDNIKKNWFAKTNDKNLSIKIIEKNISQLDTLLPRESFWINNIGEAQNINFDIHGPYFESPYEVGDLKDYNLSNLHLSFGQTTGAIVQAILAVNSVIYTDVNETNITEFKSREAQAIQALDILIELSQQTKDFADELPDPIQTARLLRTIGTPQEIYAIINNSKIKGHIKTLMQHYNVGAKQAKKILDDAMSSLESKYSNKADFYTKAIVVSQAIKDTSALALTVGTTVMTAGATTTALGVATTIISGSDALIKATKSGVELYLGQDGALDGAIKNSIVLRGISDINEIISVKSLFESPDKAADTISKTIDTIGKFVWCADKSTDAFYNKKVNFGEEKIDFSNIGKNELNSTTQKLDSFPAPSTFIGNFEQNSSKIYTSSDSNVLETNVTKVLDLDNTKITEGKVKKISTQNISSVVKKALNTLPEEKKIQETKKMLEEPWKGFPKPQFCKAKISSDDVYSNGILKTFELGENHFLYCYYYYDGLLETESEKENGKQIGVHIIYSEDIIYPDEDSFKTIYFLSEFSHYENGKKHGETKTYYSSGKLHTIAKYIDDLKDGVYLKYYKSGNIYIEAHYANGLKNGKYQSYYDSGSIMHDESYLDGKENGDFKTFREDGCLLAHEVYSNGNLVQSSPILECH